MQPKTPETDNGVDELESKFRELVLSIRSGGYGHNTSIEEATALLVCACRPRSLKVDQRKARAMRSAAYWLRQFADGIRDAFLDPIAGWKNRSAERSHEKIMRLESKLRAMSKT